MCEGFFRSEMVLQQHMAKIHFWPRLLALPRQVGGVAQCPEFPCRYQHGSAVVVSAHLATEHKVVFRIARDLFPNFTLSYIVHVCEQSSSEFITASEKL